MRRGFTLIELLVVLAIISTLLSIALPRYYGSVKRAEEATLRQNLALMRDAIDKHYADTGRYPETLEALVTRRYLRRVPLDPLTGSDATWVAVPAADPQQRGVFDVHSGADANAIDGSAVNTW
jgi:general secretion pathway protein G